MVKSESNIPAAGGVDSERLFFFIIIVIIIKSPITNTNTIAYLDM
jgi:hypothetical protein